MDIIDPLDTGSDQKEGECDSPTEAAAMVAAETCLVVESDLGMEPEEVQRPLVAAGSKRSRRRNVVLQQTLVENIIESDAFEYKATEAAAGGGEGAGTVTYRVVQVAASSAGGEEVEGIQHIINPSSSGNYAAGTTAPGVQVLTSPINGQFYVIGSPQEVFTTTSSTARSIAPRGQNDNVRSTTRRDERRRATHNEVERRRRDKINSWIMKLGKIIPDCGNEGGKQGQVSFEGQSKGGILAKACDYIVELRAANQRMAENLKENERLALQAEALRQQNDELRRDRLALHAQLSQNGITPCVDLTASQVTVQLDQDPLS